MIALSGYLLLLLSDAFLNLLFFESRLLFKFCYLRLEDGQLGRLLLFDLCIGHLGCVFSSGSDFPSLAPINKGLDSSRKARKQDLFSSRTSNMADGASCDNFIVFRLEDKVGCRLPE